LSGGVESTQEELPIFPVDELPVLDTSNISPTSGTTTSAETRTNPAFLGSNPIDILKNLTIGTRTQ
jgi:hypothetical protein